MINIAAWGTSLRPLRGQPTKYPGRSLEPYKVCSSEDKRTRHTHRGLPRAPAALRGGSSHKLGTSPREPAHARAPTGSEENDLNLATATIAGRSVAPPTSSGRRVCPGKSIPSA